MNKLEELGVEAEPPQEARSNGTAPVEPCSLCGSYATAACPKCDADHDHIWTRMAPPPELEEDAYPH